MRHLQNAIWIVILAGIGIGVALVAQTNGNAKGLAVAIALIGIYVWRGIAVAPVERPTQIRIFFLGREVEVKGAGWYLLPFGWHHQIIETPPIFVEVELEGKNRKPTPKDNVLMRVWGKIQVVADQNNIETYVRLGKVLGSEDLSLAHREFLNDLMKAAFQQWVDNEYDGPQNQQEAERVGDDDRNTVLRIMFGPLGDDKHIPYLEHGSGKKTHIPTATLIRYLFGHSPQTLDLKSKYADPIDRDGEWGPLKRMLNDALNKDAVEKAVRERKQLIAGLREGTSELRIPKRGFKVISFVMDAQASDKFQEIDQRKAEAEKLGKALLAEANARGDAEIAAAKKSAIAREKTAEGVHKAYEKFDTDFLKTPEGDRHRKETVELAILGVKKTIDQQQHEHKLTLDQGLLNAATTLLRPLVDAGAARIAPPPAAPPAPTPPTPPPATSDEEKGGEPK